MEDGLRRLRPRRAGIRGEDEAEALQGPGLFDRDAVLHARNLREFDNVFTAPLHGFRDTDD